VHTVWLEKSGVEDTNSLKPLETYPCAFKASSNASSMQKPRTTAAHKPPTTRPTGVIIAVQPPRMRQGVLAAAPSAVPAGSAAQKSMPAKPKCAQEDAAGALDKSKAAPSARQKVSDLDAAQVIRPFAFAAFDRRNRQAWVRVLDTVHKKTIWI